VFTVFASGGQAVRATADNVVGDSVTWSPDGTWLAFRLTAGGKAHVAKVRIGGNEIPQKLAETCGAPMPEWSPTGEWIAYWDPSCQLSLVSPDGKEKRGIGGGGPVAWSRDGRTLYRFHRDKQTINAIDIATGHERTVRHVGELLPYSGPGPGLRATLSADGKSIVYSVLRAREEIWILENVKIERPWWSWAMSLLGR